MDPLRTYEYLTLARRRVLDWARPLSPEQHAQQFPIGPGSILRTLTHMMISEWYYIERMEGRSVPPYDQWPVRDENPPPLAEIGALWAQQEARTRAAIAAVRDWAAPVEYRITDDDGRLVDIVASRADIVTQLVLHEVHHRAQVMNMLRHLGVAVDDIDFNTLMYRRRPVAP
jgi:uncharacterized damage-inducible protein DinB